MAEHQSNAQIASLEGMKKSQKKKVLKRMYKEVAKDKRYRKALKKSPERVSRKAANAAAAAAVDAVLGVKTGEPAVPKKKTALDRYTALVGTFSTLRKKHDKKVAKERKAFHYNEKTGFYELPRLKPIKKAKLNKPYKAKKITK